jgi:2-phosphosulfolactate phosphatase
MYKRVSTKEEAFFYKQQHPEVLLAGEEQGYKIDGFDFGNSPFSYTKAEFKGQDVVLTTTNGTKSLDVAKDAEIVVVGSFLNLDALTNWLEKQDKNILCLCSGWQDKFNLEDTICAGAICDALINTGIFTSVEDSSIAAKYLYLSAKDNYLGFLKSSSHRRRPLPSPILGINSARLRRQPDQAHAHAPGPRSCRTHQG